MAHACLGCRDGAAFAHPFSMAFQPIVDRRSGRIFAHEALVRGVAGEGAGSVLSLVQDEMRYAFDQQCRVKAIELASTLFDHAEKPFLSINFMPRAVYEPRACIRLTLDTAKRTGFPLDRIIFEFTENEQLDTGHVLAILNTYREIGFKTAIDDFGAGYAGLNLLSRFQPDIVKLDMALIRGIDTDRVRQIMVGKMVEMLHALGVEVVCEGVETTGEFHALADLNVDYIQGYLVARPSFEALSAISLPLAA
ncbi:diguanylate phosphodiesterase [Rhizobium rhizosphaerae]|uniref:Diguanylate phosphodiesterase n=1 Tax=Xaviernesmea rhizosphaerae TaxID=1672749 RepID=A0ABX3PFL3_9HYPH|nr:EAL domain-containing protein [Xaviernesmea rhizosphaerae]OQP86823.1 diguanylate phosphodiesterase [Xaviernesmea rhizosphaerae]